MSWKVTSSQGTWRSSIVPVWSLGAPCVLLGAPEGNIECDIMEHISLKPTQIKQCKKRTRGNDRALSGLKHLNNIFSMENGKLDVDILCYDNRSREIRNVILLSSHNPSRELFRIHKSASWNIFRIRKSSGWKTRITRLKKMSPPVKENKSFGWRNSGTWLLDNIWGPQILWLQHIKIVFCFGVFWEFPICVHIRWIRFWTW